MFAFRADSEVISRSNCRYLEGSAHVAQWRRGRERYPSGAESSSATPFGATFGLHEPPHLG